MASLSQLDYQSYRKKLLHPCPPPGHESEPPRDTEAPLFFGRAFLFLINTRWFWGDEPGVENWPEARRHWRERPRAGDDWGCTLLQAHDSGTCLWSISSHGTLPLMPHPPLRMVLRVQRNHLGKALGPRAAKPTWEPKEMEMTWKSDSDSASTCLDEIFILVFVAGSCLLSSASKDGRFLHGSRHSGVSCRFPGLVTLLTELSARLGGSSESSLVKGAKQCCLWNRVCKVLWGMMNVLEKENLLASLHWASKEARPAGGGWSLLLRSLIYSPHKACFIEHLSEMKM